MLADGVYSGTGNKSHNIQISYDVEDGKVKNTVVWVNGLDGQGYKSGQN